MQGLYLCYLWTAKSCTESMGNEKKILSNQKHTGNMSLDREFLVGLCNVETLCVITLQTTD